MLWAVCSPANETKPLAVHRTRTVQASGGHKPRTDDTVVSDIHLLQRVKSSIYTLILVSSVLAA
jgi:hypothetical protein